MADPEKTRFQEHVEEAKRKKELQGQTEARRERTAARFRAAVNEVGKSRAGMDFFAGLFHLCGYNCTSVVTDPESGEVLASATGYNDARRSVYVDIRRNLDPELRAKIEQLAEVGEDAEKTMPAKKEK